MNLCVIPDNYAVFLILLSDWPILIVTYSYGIFTAKKLKFTTKSYHLRKKTIPGLKFVRIANRRCLGSAPCLNFLVTLAVN